MHQRSEPFRSPVPPSPHSDAWRSTPITLERRDVVGGVRIAVQVGIECDGALSIHATLTTLRRVGVTGIGYTVVVLDDAGEPIWTVSGRRFRIGGRWDRRAPSHRESDSDARVPRAVLARMRYVAIVSRTDDDGIAGLRFAAREAAVWVGSGGTAADPGTRRSADPQLR